MRFSPDQQAIMRASALAIAVAAAALAAAWLWLPPGLFGLDRSMDAGERVAFALRADLLVFLWLAGCVRAVSSGRFRSPADIRGSAFAPPSSVIAVKAAVLQNSLEQTVLAVGAHLILSVALRGRELVLIPMLVFLYLLGRVTFALGYAKGPSGRSFGMALTGASVIAAYALAGVLMISGR